jgi:hypothetical protein
VTIESGRAGTRPLTLSYLTPGLSWRADYVTLFDEEAGRIDVQGWITLTNNSGTAYNNADTLLVAGSVAQVGGNMITASATRRPRPAARSAAGT